MDKENGENNEGGSSSSKLPNPSDSSALLDAANLFAYWPRSDANSSNAANLFAAGAYGMGPHPSMSYGMLPPSTGRSVPSYPPSSSVAAAFSNAYTNTLSVAASQAASLGIPAASAAWWSMASHLAAQDYLARLQASGLNFSGIPSPNDLPYSSLGLPSLSSHHKSVKSSKNTPLPKHQGSSKPKSITNSVKSDHLDSSNANSCVYSKPSSTSSKYSSSGLTIQPSMKLPNSTSSTNTSNDKKNSKLNDLNYLKSLDKSRSATPKTSQPVSSIFTNPLSLVSNSEKSTVTTSSSSEGLVNSSTVVSSVPSILSAALEGNNDPNSILGGVRLPPDTEIIKYTSSIVGPKVPGTTNRGRKKTISLDPPSVSVHPSLSNSDMLVERASKRPKLNDLQDLNNTSKTASDRVEVIKLPPTNGNTPSTSPFPRSGSFSEFPGDTPLNLSLKPTACTSLTSSSLNSLSNMSANLGADRISRRKPGPKPRRVIQSPSHLPPGAPSASLAQLFASADSPRPPSRSEENLSISTATTTVASTNSSTLLTSSHHKDGRPRNLGRGVSKPKKNTVASLLAQSRALGIKPMPILDPNASMNQQMSLLKSNILAAQQFIAESGGDEKTLNKFLQERFKNALSDSSTVEASTDSDNLTDSNQTDSEMENDAVAAGKKQKQFDEFALRLPMEKGWKRETIIRGLSKNGGIKGDVSYVAPESSNKFKQMSDITQYLDYQNDTEFSKDNFTFSSRVILGDYLQPVPAGMATDSEYIHLNEDDVNRRLDELKTATRTNLAVEQRIELARKQQAARAQARLDREQARLQREIEKSERQEAARREREARSQQLLEGRKRLAFTLEQKMQIISEIEGGKTKSDVSRELGLASSTVATIWKNRDNIISAYGTESFTRDIPKLIDNEKIKNISDSSVAYSDNVLMAKRRRQEEMEKHKHEEQQRKQQEREIKRQQAALLKEQERERRRQHMALVKALESRRKLEERERKKQQLLAEKQASKERKLEQRRIEMEILTELRKPCEDLELPQKPLPEYDRIPGIRIPGQALADIFMVFEFLHNFGETLGFDMESLPTLDSLQQALLYNETPTEAEEELLSVMTHLLVCAIEDPGIPNPNRHTTILGQSLRQADITHANLSEILRIYLYANATGEVKALTGVNFERERERRVPDHHQTGCEMLQTLTGKNANYYELLRGNATWKMSDILKDKPFLALSPTDKAAILAYICNELLQNKAVIRQIEGSLDNVALMKKERWLLDAKIRKLRMMHNRKVRSEAVEKAQAKADGENHETAVDSPALHKDDLLDDEDNEMSEIESVGTQPEEEEDNKLSGEELGKKLEKLIKTSESQLHNLNTSAHQLRATCYGQDRYWRRYWSLPKLGGIYIESIESAQPEVLEDLINEDKDSKLKIKTMDDIKRMMNDVDSIQDPNVDREVSEIVEESEQIKENSIKLIDDENNPSRLDIIENGDISDMCERNLDELRKSVDKIVQNLDRGIEQGKNNLNQDINESHDNNNKIDSNHVDSIENKKVNYLDNNKIKVEIIEGDQSLNVTKKFNLFEKLGECMEKESRNDLQAEIKAEMKEELKNEILKELKSDIDIKNELKMEHDDEKSEAENKWFSILSKEGTCEGVHLTAGNRWDTGCLRENITELKIPVFPPPNNSNYLANCCESPGPLQMTAEEGVQLEYIKKHGMPKPCERETIPVDKRYGWWRIIETEQLKSVLDHLHVRGTREKELKRTFTSTMQSMYERQGKLHIEEGQREAMELSTIEDEFETVEGGAPAPDVVCAWSSPVSHRVDLSVLEQVETLEDKVANASMQIKGWRVPSRDGPDLGPGEAVTIAKDRLAVLETAIERRYLKPPLGASTGDPNLAAIAQEAAGGTAPPQPIPAPDEISKGLAVWRDAVTRAQTSAQLAMCLYSLESSIAWDKSIMKAVSQSHVFDKQRARKYNTKLSNCQFCHSGDNEDKLLLCDGCDKGYHTYCFKPKMDNIPEGDWYCHECMNKATGERNCIVCGKKQSATGTRLLVCEVCPRAYHTDCIRPVLHKAPRGKWYCSNCISKKPQKKTVRKSIVKPTRDSESSDHPPNSPAPSHSSATTNEDLNNQQPSDVSNCSLSNTGSPSTQGRKERVSKKLLKELAPCKLILEDLECHDDAWPFLLPVNTKQFPTYKKIIKNPMDFSSIKKRLQEVYYKSKEEFCVDVRQIFNNCEIFNEDDSPVGKAGHCMRQFFEARWNELCVAHS